MRTTNKTFTRLAGPLAVLGLLAIFCPPSRLQASTGEGSFIITSVSGGSFQAKLRRWGYLSSYKDQNGGLHPDIGQILTISKIEKKHNRIVEGLPTSIETFRNALRAGQNYYQHMNRNSHQFASIHNGKPMKDGEVLEVNHAEQTFQFIYVLKNSRSGLGEGPARDTITVDYDPSWVFKHEGEAMPAEQAIKKGNYIRLYQERNQTIESFDPEALEWDQTNTRSWLQKGFFRGIQGGNSYFAEHRDEEWVNSYKPRVPGHFMIKSNYFNTTTAAARPGDRIVFIPYNNHNGDRDTWKSREIFVSPQDDETIQGTLKAVNGNTITLEVVRCPTGLAKDIDTTMVEITLKDDAKYHLNGQIGKSKDQTLKVGNYLIVKKEWTGAVLSRDEDQDKIALDQTPWIKPRFIALNFDEIVLNDERWQQPDSYTVEERGDVTLQTHVMTTPGTSYQWTKDGEPIESNHEKPMFYAISNAQVADSGCVFRLKASNPAGTTMSPPITLHVEPDNTPLTANAQIMDANTIEVEFNQVVLDDDGTHGAENLSNYALSNGVSVDSAVLLYPDKKTVVLKTSDMTEGQDYDLTISDIKSFLTASPNGIPDGSTTQRLTYDSDAPGGRKFQSTTLDVPDYTIEGKHNRVSYPDVEISSGLKGSFKIIKGPASLGIQLLLEDTGTVVIELRQEGNDEYYPLTPVRDTFKIMGEPVALEEPATAQEKFQFYPNPSNGRITIESSEVGSVQILDMNGRLLEERGVRKGRQSLQLTNMPGGMYILRFKSRSGQASTKKLKLE